jgi:hypothetical protein
VRRDVEEEGGNGFLEERGGAAGPGASRGTQTRVRPARPRRQCTRSGAASAGPGHSRARPNRAGPRTHSERRRASYAHGHVVGCAQPPVELLVQAGRREGTALGCVQENGRGGRAEVLRERKKEDDTNERGKANGVFGRKGQCSRVPVKCDRRTGPSPPGVDMLALREEKGPRGAGWISRRAERKMRFCDSQNASPHHISIFKRKWPASPPSSSTLGS